MVTKKHKTIEGHSKLIELKNSMNTKRSYFNWGHLDAYNKSLNLIALSRQDGQLRISCHKLLVCL